jgi:hypothetical protein
MPSLHHRKTYRKTYAIGDDCVCLHNVRLRWISRVGVLASHALRIPTFYHRVKNVASFRPIDTGYSSATIPIATIAATHEGNWWDRFSDPLNLVS